MKPPQSETGWERGTIRRMLTRRDKMKLAINQLATARGEVAVFLT